MAISVLANGAGAGKGTNVAVILKGKSDQYSISNSVHSASLHLAHLPIHLIQLRLH